jgi:small conductance mechanosensitive channel
MDVSLTAHIVITVLILLLALSIGLLLRRLLVHWLKETFLDNWLIQTLGVIVVILPLIVAAAISPFILNPANTQHLKAWWDYYIKNQFHLPDFTTLIWNLIGTLLILLIGIGIARTLFKLMIRSQGHLDINLRTLIGRIFYIITLIIAVFWILSLWQVSIAVPVAVISALAVAGAFAIQDILKDLVAGLYILSERPFHIGDEISTANYTGKVEDILIRATRLRLVSGEQVTIPNALVFGGIVINNTYYGERRATIAITMPQENYQQEKTPALILQTLAEIETVMVKPEPTIFISGYEGEKMTLTLRFWVENRQLVTVSEVMYTLRTVLPNADFTVLESAGNV